MTALALAAAHEYAGRRWSVLPLESRGKKTITGGHGKDDATADLSAIASMFRGDCNIGIACEQSGIVVVDVDDDQRGGGPTFAALVAELGELPTTITAITGSGGAHYLFRAPPVALIYKLGKGVELISHGYIVAPPSVHPSGRPYAWRAGLAPGQVELAELPPSWLAWCRRAEVAPVTPSRTRTTTSGDELTARRAAAYLAKMEPSISGQGGHGALFAAALAMIRGFELSTADAYNLIASDFNPRCMPPWSERDLRHKVEDAGKSAIPSGYLLTAELPSYSKSMARTAAPASRFDDVPLPDGPSFFDEEAADRSSVATASRDGAGPDRKLTELGNAERLAAAHGQRLRFVKAWRKWLAWDGRRWCRDEVGAEIVAAKKVTRDLYSEAAELARGAARGVDGSADKAADLVVWANRSATEHGLRAMATLAQTEPPIAAVADGFDADQWALNVMNGTIDLRTGILRPHRQTDLITQLAPVAFDPSATCPKWIAFIDRVLPDPAVREWVQRFVGYTLTGDVGAQVLAFFLGVGANGKSTFLGVVQALLGDYAVQGSPGLLLASERGGDDQGKRQRAALRGRRLVICQEIEAGRNLNEAQVKMITGDGKITAARLYEDETEFSPTHKIAIAANHKPHVRGQDHGIWRRIRLVPFTVTIPSEERDPGLQAKLMAEAPGILAWAVRGCLEWQRVGLGAPVAITSATDAYKADEDRLGEFLELHTVADSTAAVASADLHRLHCEWSRQRDERPWSSRSLASALEERGFALGRPRIGGHQVRGVLGLRLRANGEQDA